MTPAEQQNSLTLCSPRCLAASADSVYNLPASDMMKPGLQLPEKKPAASPCVSLRKAAGVHVKFLHLEEVSICQPKAAQPRLRVLRHHASRTERRHHRGLPSSNQGIPTTEAPIELQKTAKRLLSAILQLGLDPCRSKLWLTKQRSSSQIRPSKPSTLTPKALRQTHTFRQSQTFPHLDQAAQQGRTTKKTSRAMPACRTKP